MFDLFDIDPLCCFVLLIVAAALYIWNINIK